MNKRRPLTKILLTVLANATNTTVELGQLTLALGQGYGTAWRRGGREYVAEIKHLRQARRLRTTLNQLRYKKYIVARKTGNHLLISLTPKGRAATLVYRLQQATPHPAGYYTVVIFDIPESQAWARKQFRLLLKQGGFTKLQQSVWVSRADTYKAVVEFVQKVKLQSWVNVYHATNFLNQPLHH